jgi:Na+/H+ antiporter NhaC
MIIAFSTGTSWGTYAIAFPLAMPLAWVIAESQGLANPEIYMAICFATVLNGSVYGDQCSPISDTTILSAMTTGCDLMDHVKSQIFPASVAAFAAAVLWTLCTLILV